ncbi:MAG TPA: DNA methyltransferase [Actinomycetes bacterium]|jgi:SAM-dependent methyltransferase|nr:DNA methyltransferase [Actinomycetes bacterium]
MTAELDFGPAGHLYATHPLHAFAARCPPPLVDWAISRFSAPGDVVLDPMVGSGTTLVEAALLGRRAWGADIDPLSRLIAKAKATPIPIASWDLAIEQVETGLAEPLGNASWRPDLPKLDRWFLPSVAADLSGLRTLISTIHCEPDARDLLWVAFSALIVARTSVANARDLVHSRHHYRRWDHDPDVNARFLKNLRRFRRLLVDYLDRLEQAGNAKPDVRIVGDDARRLPVADASVDLLFTSPPYCSALDYTRAHVFAVAWMPEILGTGVAQYRTLGRTYVGSERAPLAGAPTPATPPPSLGLQAVDEVVRALSGDLRRSWVVHRYFRDMAGVLQECRRVVRPGGRVVLIICPSNIRKVSIPTHVLLAETARSMTDLEIEDVLERTIHERRRVMPYLEAAFGARMQQEYVVVLRRPGGSSSARSR